jgi:hypothetical protein
MTADQYFKRNNQPKTDGRDGGEKGKKMGEVWFHSFGGERVWRDVK